MQESIDLLFQSYPFLKTIVFWIVFLRMVNKSLFTIGSKFVQNTENKQDDEKFNKITNNKFYKSFSFILDLLASIKLPQAKIEEKK